MPRALFEKVGNARYISHLDLMRLFQRAFKRAGLPLTHTQGFNPRPSVSIALPLSLGVESHCELLDFELEELVDCAEIQERLNQTLVSGVRILQVYTDAQKIRNLSLLRSRLTLEYDHPLPTHAVKQISDLLHLPELVVEKKSKNGITQQDILPMIHRFSAEQISEREISVSILHNCQNPSLNPLQFAAAIEKYLPELSADYVRCCREELFDEKEEIFR